MRVPDRKYLQAVEEQVDLMLAKANAMHPEFEQDCLYDLERIPRHWTDGLRIRYVNRIADSDLRNDVNTVYDDDRAGSANGKPGNADLLGLFSPALGRRKLNHVQVQWTPNDYTQRRNFTLLHELGHYLQQTDDELAMRICMISSTNYEKRFEEDACNRFASKALLPDREMRARIDEYGLNAFLAYRLYEDGRHDTNIRVSRDVVTRRIADFLPENAYAALATLNRGAKTPGGSAPKLQFRAYGNRAVEYDKELSRAERLLLEDAKGVYWKDACYKPEKEVFAELPPAERPADISVMKSFAGRRLYYFMLFFPQQAA